MVNRLTSLQAHSQLRCHSVFSGQLNKIVVSIIMLFSAFAGAQTPIGLYEGLLGNSGAALVDSSAPSFYNPSLLARKTAESYAISGNTFGSFSSKSDSQETSSVNVYPSYLSSIFISESLIHEIFLINLAPTRIKNIVFDNTASTTSRSESNREGNKILVGYSMAFRKVPFALSYFAQYTEIQEFGYTEFSDLASTLRSTSINKGSFSSLAAGVSVSGHSKFESYTLGYNLKIKPGVLYRKNKSEITSYTRGRTIPSDYEVNVSESEVSETGVLGTALVIGHDFRSGEHEFITDTVFSEKSNLSNSYEISQSFGYRFSSGSGHQFLCGLTHALGGDIKYIGQKVYVSTGYSWINKINRSTVGLYYYSSKVDELINAAGLTFGSEFLY